jgi:hypothetical protein
MMTDIHQLPHLIHIGFPKCASTFIQKWFEANPQVLYRHWSLAGMHNVFDLLEDLDGSDALRCRVTSAEQLSCPHPAGRDGVIDLDRLDERRDRATRVCKLLGNLYPEAHILVVTRGFSDVLRSGFSEYIRSGADVTWEEFASYDLASFERDNSFDYDFIIELYRSQFAGRVTILPFELLTQDRRTFLGRIEASMGLDAFEPEVAEANPSLRPDELYWYPRISKLIRKVPGRLSYLGLGFHRRMIRSGRWHPVLRVLRVIQGKRENQTEIPQDYIDGLTASASLLAQEELYQPFREAYLPKTGD